MIWASRRFGYAFASSGYPLQPRFLPAMRDKKTARPLLSLSLPPLLAVVF
jgi:hypothetical protein